MGWPSHGARGRHDWATYLERGYIAPFRDVLREMPDVVDAAIDDSGRTMLMYAVSENGGWLELVTLLIGAGADVNRREANGRPVWDFVSTSGPSCVEVWRTLVNAGLDVNSRGVKNETPLISLCAVYLAPATDPPRVLSHRTIVQLLLDAGAEVNVVDKYNDSPLSAASSWPGNIEVVKILLKAGADPNQVGNGTRSALFNAATHGHAHVAQALLQARAHVEAATLGSRGNIDVKEVTPLIAAIEAGHFHVVHLLADAGADVNRPDSSGFTPLMGAARAGHAKMVQFLLERGARHDAVDASGRDARKYAAEFHHQGEIAPILQRGSNKDGAV